MCIADHIPFTYHREGEALRMDIKGVLQGLLVAAVTGIIVMYGAQKTFTVQLETIDKQLVDIKNNQNQFRRDFYAPKR